MVAIAAPVTQCCQFAAIITNNNGASIIKLLNNDFVKDDNLSLFIGYFDILYTTSIAELIRGGHTYTCDVEYSWLIKNNFHINHNNLIPDDITKINDFILNISDDFINNFINNEPEEINYLYQIMRSFKPKKEYMALDRIILAAYLHQTKTFKLLNDSKEQNLISDKLNAGLKEIIINVRKIRNGFIQEKQKEVNKKSNKLKESEKYLANLGLLIVLNPSFIDFDKQSISIQKENISQIYKFIKNNNPYDFKRVLKIVPKRIDHVLNGFKRLNLLFHEVQNEEFQRVIIDGISRVDSFERLGYLLSNVELNDQALSELTAFSMTCIDMIIDNHQFSIL